MLSKILFVQKLFIHIIIVYFIFYGEENENQRKTSALNITTSFVSHLDTLSKMSLDLSRYNAYNGK